MDIYRKISALFPGAGERLKTNYDLAAHTSFRIGGIADCLFLPTSFEEVRTVKKFIQEENIAGTLLGRCSNVVIADAGIRGLTIVLADNLSTVTLEDDIITAAAGANLAAVSALAAQNSLSGLEFASGIPGTVGGAIMMNAGAYDGCIADTVVWTDYLNENNELKRLDASAHNFGYRHSFFTKSKAIALETSFHLKKGNQKEIFARMAELARKRRNSQPLELPSAGSAFKRPPGNYAGKLISDCGLRGFQIGGAAVSQKHAGFIVNLGRASAQDVLEVFCHVQKTVFRHTGVLLEPEIKFAGDWQNSLNNLSSCHII